MADDPAYLRNLRSLSRSDPQFSDLPALEEELYGASDRTTAIMLASMVERSLRRLLSKSLRNDLTSEDERRLFENEGALGSFASKIILAYALKLLGPVSRRDLDLIRILRNEFAHSRMSFGFSTPEVRAVCEQLKIPDYPESMIPNGFIVRGTPEEQSKTHPKARYICACHSLAYRMLVVRDGLKEGDFVFLNDDPLP